MEPTIYTAHYEDSIILLDSKENKYLSIIGDAAFYLDVILSNEFQCDQNIYRNSLGDFDERHLNTWIAFFKQKEMIVETCQPQRKYRAVRPLKAGGLIDYKWDLKPSWKPLASASKLEVMQAFFQLVNVHRLMKRGGIKDLLERIQKKSSGNFYDPSEHEINKLAAAVDAASLFYPKKVFCLAWAATFVLLALKKNWSCQLLIGVQTNPFYAHAWAKCAGQVVNDDPTIADVLSIILKEPQW